MQRLSTTEPYSQVPNKRPPTRLIFFEKNQTPLLLYGPPYLLILYIFCYENFSFLPNFENFKMRRFSLQSAGTTTIAVGRSQVNYIFYTENLFSIFSRSLKTFGNICQYSYSLVFLKKVKKICFACENFVFLFSTIFPSKSS